jgi:hypothetical protein
MFLAIFVAMRDASSLLTFKTVLAFTGDTLRATGTTPNCPTRLGATSPIVIATFTAKNIFTDSPIWRRKRDEDRLTFRG